MSCPQKRSRSGCSPTRCSSSATSGPWLPIARSASTRFFYGRIRSSSRRTASLARNATSGNSRRQVPPQSKRRDQMFVVVHRRHGRRHGPRREVLRNGARRRNRAAIRARSPVARWRRHRHRGPCATGTRRSAASAAEASVCASPNNASTRRPIDTVRPAPTASMVSSSRRFPPRRAIDVPWAATSRGPRIPIATEPPLARRLPVSYGTSPSGDGECGAAGPVAHQRITSARSHPCSQPVCTGTAEQESRNATETNVPDRPRLGPRHDRHGVRWRRTGRVTGDGTGDDDAGDAPAEPGSVIRSRCRSARSRMRPARWTSRCGAPRRA